MLACRTISSIQSTSGKRWSCANQLIQAAAHGMVGDSPTGFTNNWGQTRMAQKERNMGLWSNLFGENKYVTEIRKSMGNETALLPSFPLTKQISEPLQVFQVGDYYITLLVNVKPFIHERFGNAEIPVCIFAMNIKTPSVCVYSVQTVIPNEPPYLVVWQTNGQYRVINDRFNVPVNPDGFLRAYFPALLKELGFKDSVEVVKMARRPD